MSPHSTLIRHLLLGLAILISGCAAPTSVVLAPGPVPQGGRPLDWRLTHVRISHQRVLHTLSTIDREISRQSGLARTLTWSVELGTPDPAISIEAHDLTVRSLLLEICRHADLSCEIDDWNSPYDIYIKARKQSEHHT